MTKTTIELELQQDPDTKEYSLSKIRNLLGENNDCYVLITCSAPKDDGKMNVEMFYDGDEVLASYLVTQAEQILDSRIESNHHLESKIE